MILEIVYILCKARANIKVSGDTHSKPL